MEQNSQPVAPKKKSRKKIFAIIAIVVVIIIIIAIIAIPRTTNLVSGGTVESVQAGEYYVIEFNTTGSGTFAASVTATNGVTFYLLTPSQYSSDVSASTWSAYTFTSGHISSGSFNSNIGSGTWYAVLYNSNLVTESTITINSMTFTT